jgi:hypothetical protein
MSSTHLTRLLVVNVLALTGIPAGAEDDTLEAHRLAGALVSDRQSPRVAVHVLIAKVFVPRGDEESWTLVGSHPETTHEQQRAGERSSWWW